MQEHESRAPIIVVRPEYAAGEHRGRPVALVVIECREVDDTVNILCRAGVAAEQDDRDQIRNRCAVPHHTLRRSSPPGSCPKPIEDAVYAQAATARRAITLTRCARYSALAWMSELSPSSLIAMSLIASGVKERASAASISGTRNTDGPAPVTATRTPAGVRATKTPTIA